MRQGLRSRFFINEVLRKRPVSAMGFTGDEFRIHKFVSIPFCKQCQSVLHPGMNSTINESTLTILYKPVRQSSKCAINRNHAEVGKSIGVLFSILIRVFIPKLVKCCFAFFQSLGISLIQHSSASLFSKWVHSYSYHSRLLLGSHSLTFIAHTVKAVFTIFKKQSCKIG